MEEAKKLDEKVEEKKIVTTKGRKKGGKKDEKKKEERKEPFRLQEPKSYKRRNHLVEIEKEMQKLWEEEKPFYSDAPSDYSELSFEEKNKQKFFNTFPFPYMNGALHLGHAFSVTKNEFQTRFQRMIGKHVLFPFGFHCTGMPIMASADKLREEIEKGTTHDKFNSQWNILLKSGIKEEEMPKFIDTQHWLSYFPTSGMKNLKEFGLAVDWRRSFITTKVNPFFSAFVRWNFNTLKKSDKFTYGKRHTVFAPKDNSPCCDHDRSTGEYVTPQEYTLIKLKLLEIPPVFDSLKELEGFRVLEPDEEVGSSGVYMVAGTLRPETMYGQTNVFVLPDGEYGVYKMKTGEYFITSEHSIRNMAYQEMTDTFGAFQNLLTVKGWDLMGIPLNSPLTPYSKIYSLPMLTISMSKGTGIVISVPSDSPDDYAALRDLQTKKDLREKFKLKDEWVMEYSAIPIIRTTEFGEMAAETVCNEMKIKSQNDRDKLKLAKDKVYLKGFNTGVMSIGEFKGEKVKDVKLKVKQIMVDSNQACSYWEPESLVVSRSGDKCVVALCDQWVIKYGEEEWKASVKEYLKSGQFRSYNEITQNAFEETLDWLKEWACSRTYGLGTPVPWDPEVIIESLSDSTIYMAYYTIAHFLQGTDNLSGTELGPMGIKPEQMTDEVFDYIFINGEYPEDCGISVENLNIMRNEFNYWYPMDLRCSAKDLIKNHLTFSLYIHAAIWKNQKMMPRGFFCNGIINLNGMKMSKHMGNFFTIEEAMEKFGTDSTRMSLSDSGDTFADGNFLETSADAAISKLFILKQFIIETFKSIDGELDWSKEKELSTLLEEVFENEINMNIEETRKAYDSIKYRESLKFGFFDMQIAKDEYISNLTKGEKMNTFLILRFIKTQLLLLYPICPHMCDYCWRNLFIPKMKELGVDTLPDKIVDVGFPKPSAPFNKITNNVSTYLRSVKRNLILSYNKLKKPNKSKKGDAPKELTKGIIFVAKTFPEWQRNVLRLMESLEMNEDNQVVGDFIPLLREHFQKKEMNAAVKFANEVKERAKEMGKDAFAETTLFNEQELLHKQTPFLLHDLPIKQIEIYELEEECPFQDLERTKKAATPGNPSMTFI